MAGYPQVYSSSFVTGRLLNNMQVILVDATIELWVTNRATIYARLL